MSLTNSGASSGGTQTIAATNLSSTTFQQSQPSQMIQQQSQTAPTVATATVVTPQSQQHLPTSYVGIGLATTYSSSSPTPITLQRTTHHHHHCSAAHPYLRSSQLVAANAASITLPACITVNRDSMSNLTLTSSNHGSPNSPTRNTGTSNSDYTSSFIRSLDNNNNNSGSSGSGNTHHPVLIEESVNSSTATSGSGNSMPATAAALISSNTSPSSGQSSSSSPTPTSVTLTLITTTTTSTTATPLIPIQPVNLQAAAAVAAANHLTSTHTTTPILASSLASSNVANGTATVLGSTHGLSPTTSAISSSSSPPSQFMIVANSASTCNGMSASTSRDDWFTYVYEIENIEELIRAHEQHQLNSTAQHQPALTTNGLVHSSSATSSSFFVQSPVFSFTNHLVGTTTASNSATNTTSTSTTNNIASNTTAPAVTNQTTSGSTSATGSISSSSSSGAKQPSQWRLIFYPNGAGPDCKNFLSIFLKYMSDEPVKIQMMFSIVDNQDQDVYVKYTVNRFVKANDWGFKQLIHRNAILFQKDKFLKLKQSLNANGVPTASSGAGTLRIKIKMRLDEHKHEYIKKLNDDLHYCKLLSENISQYYYNQTSNSNSGSNNDDLKTGGSSVLTTSSSQSNSSQTNQVGSGILFTTSSSVSFASNATAASNTLGASILMSSSSLNSSSLIPKPSSSCQASSCPSVSCSTSSTSGAKMIKSITGQSVSSMSPDVNNNNLVAGRASNAAYYDVVLFVKSSESESDNISSPANILCSDCSPKNGLKRSCTEVEHNLSSNKRAKTGSQTIGSAGKTTTVMCSRCSNEMLKSSSSSSSTQYIEFHAHKCILAARSPVFKAMFQYRLSETLTSRVVIEDLRPEVIRAMLKYIYTAYLPSDADIEPIACDLYIAAEKYFIESLKIKCREYLVEHLNMDTCIQTYIVAELYNDAMLRKQALKYINENIDRVTQNSEWTELMTHYPQFFTNAFIRICKKDF